MSQEDPYNPEKMRLELSLVSQQIVEIEAKSQPLRAQRDAWVAAVQEKEQQWDKAVAEAEAGLALLKNKFSMLTKACGPAASIQAEPAALGAEGQELNVSAG